MYLRGALSFQGVSESYGDKLPAYMVTTRSASYLSALALGLALFFSSPAQAQFANKSIGLGVGYMGLNFENVVDRAFPIGLEGSLYIENGFDLVAHTYVMLLNSPVYNQQYVGMFLSGGVRYLFSEESLRPYVGLDLGYFQTFGLGDASIYRVGLGPNAGVDYFFQDTWSVGVRGQFTAYWLLNAPVNTSLGAHAVISTWF